MSKVKNEIRSRTSKLRALTGVEFCSRVASLEKFATDEEWVSAWNIDQGIIMGMINDMELSCGWIELDEYQN